MLADPRHGSFQARVRRWLGTDTLQRIEELMATEVLTLLQGLVSQTTEASAAQQASFVNIHNALNRQDTAIRDLTTRLNEAIESNGRVTPEMQEAASQVSAALADLKKAAETADDGFEPAEEPTEEQPVDVLPGDEFPPAEVPADETRTEGNARRR
jgi:hypothetical protein